MHRNSIAREISSEARRSSRLPRLEKRNREDQIASSIVGLFSGSLHSGVIAGVDIANVRFTDKGCCIDLKDGSTIEVRITAYAPDKA